MVAGHIKNLLPQGNRFERAGTDFTEAILGKGPLKLFLEKGNIFFHLVLDITQSMFLDLIMVKGSVKEKDGHIKVSSLKFIPFHDCPADVVATN
jgi:hypothetical protein